MDDATKQTIKELNAGGHADAAKYLTELHADEAPAPAPAEPARPDDAIFTPDELHAMGERGRDAAYAADPERVQRSLDAATAAKR